MELVLNKNGKITSLDLVEQINFFRKQEENITGKVRAELQHNDLLKVIRDEFEEEIGMGNISQTPYIHPQNKQTYNMFELTVSQSKQVLVRESKLVRKAVIKRLEELENLIDKITDKDRLYLGLFSKDPMVVANSHKELVRLEIKPLEDKIAQDKPLVEFANQVSSSSDSLLVREFCKVLADEKINIGQNKLYEWLRENGFVIKKKTEPTQKSMNMGLFECIERVVATPYGDKLSITTKITGKGQIYFTEKLREIYSK